MKCLALFSILVATTVLIAVPVRCVYIIKRNTQDCIYPRIQANAERLWPTNQYLPRGTTISSTTTSLVADGPGFTIEYFSTYKIVTNKVVNEKYLLYHCGTAPPSGTGISKVFQIPLTSGSVADATAADYATQLTTMDRMAYAGELAVSGCLQALAACGYVAADDPASSAIRDTVDSFWIFGFGTTTDTMSISFNAPVAKSPLDRAKWLAYVSAFYNKEAAAGALYLSIRDAYSSLRREALAQRGAPPTVCWIYKDWDGDFAISYADYKVQYVKDAGGAMPDWKQLVDLFKMQPKPAGSTTTLVFKSTYDQVASAWAGVLQQCEIIIDESYEMSTGGLTEMDAQNPDGFLQTHGIKPYANQVPAVSNGQVYTLAGTIGQTITNPNSPIKGSVGLDWFERGVSRCDEVIRDLITVIRPAARHSLLTGWQLHFLLKLDGKQQQQKVPAVCKLATAKLDGCQRAGYAARVCPNAVRDCDTGVIQFPTADQRCAAVSQQSKTRQLRRRQKKSPECLSRPISSAAGVIAAPAPNSSNSSNSSNSN